LATRGDASAAGVAFHAEFVDQLRPLRTFAAHCAMARWRLQAGELVFGSLNPFDEKMLDRMLVVRFAAMIVLTATNYEMSHAVQGTRDSFLFTAAIEVTMPTLVLADLLTSWKNVVEELQ